MSTAWVTPYTDGTFANTKLNLLGDLNTEMLSIYKAMDAMKYGYIPLHIADQRESGETYSGATRPAKFYNQNGSPCQLDFEYAASRIEYASWAFEVPNDCTADSAITAELTFKIPLASGSASFPISLHSYARSTAVVIGAGTYTTNKTVVIPETTLTAEVVKVSTEVCPMTAGQMGYILLRRTCEASALGEYVYSVSLMNICLKYERKYTV